MLESSVEEVPKFWVRSLFNVMTSEATGVNETVRSEVDAVNHLEQRASPALSDLRRQQILGAAAECFRRRGFHGASISQICNAAGMSPGHLYYFFESKEAIIGGIVERNLENSLEIISRLEGATDVFGDMLERVDQALAEKGNPDTAGLWLEVLAEAARNPDVARAVREADQKVREHIARLADRARASRGIESLLDRDAAAEVLVGLFEGVANRIIQNPDRNNEAVVNIMRIAMTAILEA